MQRIKHFYTDNTPFISTLRMNWMVNNVLININLVTAVNIHY